MVPRYLPDLGKNGTADKPYSIGTAHKTQIYNLLFYSPLCRKSYQTMLVFKIFNIFVTRIIWSPSIRKLRI